MRLGSSLASKLAMSRMRNKSPVFSQGSRAFWSPLNGLLGKSSETSSLNELKIELERVKKDFSNVDNEKNLLRVQTETLQTSLRSLQHENVIVVEKKQAAEEQLASATVLLRNLEMTSNSALESLSQAKVREEDLHRNIAALQSHLVATEQQVVSLQGELSTAVGRVDELENSLKNAVVAPGENVDDNSGGAVGEESTVSLKNAQQSEEMQAAVPRPASRPTVAQLRRKTKKDIVDILLSLPGEDQTEGNISRPELEKKLLARTKNELVSLFEERLSK